MMTVLAVAALLALGFGLGRVKHPSNLKLAAVKAEVAKLEAEGNLTIATRLKALL